nr:hypothetical protein [Tanacetum cinerariifolium]
IDDLLKQRNEMYASYIDLVEKSVKDIIKDEVTTQEHKDLYDARVKSYKLDNDLFKSYGKAYSIKRDREEKDKDEDLPARSDQWLKRRKTSKDVEPSKGSKLKELKSSSSKGNKSQPKSSGKSAQAEESVFETADTEMPQNQGSDLGNTDDQPKFEAASMHDWFKKPERPLTPNSGFNPLKGTCRIRVKLKYHFEECYKAVTDRLNWNNPEGQEYPFDLSNPLPLIEDRGRQVVPVNYFLNNDLEYLKDKFKRNRLMRLDELYKLSDGTLTSARSVLHDIASNLKMDYFPKRRWSNLDKQRSRIMIKAIDKLQLERMLMRNLEKFVGGMEYEEDFRLLERTI